MPTSLKPGVSATRPPHASGISRDETVVWRPVPVFFDRSPVRSASPGSMAFSSVDLPTPLGPMNAEVP